MSATSSSFFSPGISLLLQSIGMLLGTLLCGTIPLYLPLSKTKLRVLEVIGAGLLVGASMTVVLPEGVSAVFQAESHPEEGIHHSRATSQNNESMWTALSKRAPSHEHDHRGHDHSTSPESLMGFALLGGFLLMFLIDQVAAPGAHAANLKSSSSDNEATRNRGTTAPYLPTHRPEALRLTRSSSLATTKLNNVEDTDKSKASMHTVESSPEQLPDDHDTLARLNSPLLGNGGRSSPSRRSSQHTGNLSESGERNKTSVAQRRGLRAAFASIIGLVIHAAADGIAMGASAGSGDESLKLIVLFAIMIHKAPASFGLCTLLMGRRLHKRDIHKAIFIFSMSTPVGAILTYTLLSIFLRSEGEAISSRHIGVALTFSAGTFIYVAMHAVQELASATADIDDSDPDTKNNHHHHHHHHNSTTSSSPPEARQVLGRTGRIAVFLLGTILPKTLQSLTGHGH